MPDFFSSLLASWPPILFGGVGNLFPGTLVEKFAAPLEVGPAVDALMEDMEFEDSGSTGAEVEAREASPTPRMPTARCPSLVVDY